MNVDEIRNKILIAREKRASLREQCVQSGCDSLSLSLNIPGYPKSTSLLSAFFDDVLSEFKQFLRAHGISIDTAHEAKQIDEAGDFYIVPLLDGRPPAAVKSLTETFEERHPLGRIIDIDLVDRRLQPVSSGKLKRCLLCEQPAAVCMREASHTYEELREHMDRGIRRYLADRARQRTCRQLAALALKAILYEISVSPKPGLVGRFEQGAHHDMDYFTFIDSTSVLAGYFEELALSGYMFQGRGPPRSPARDSCHRIEDGILHVFGYRWRQYPEGTHLSDRPGLVFCRPCIARDGSVSTARCRETIAAIGANLVQNELMPTDGAEQTHGKACFQRYGSEGGGVRKEAEDGLPSVFEQGLPELKSALAEPGLLPRRHR